ncbi:MAG: glycoside hydrolase family 13 protein [Lactobacillaceae bacterium]|jgi:glycosidase|nr:glycoside hydrolase family 13 protein [Lactobacillaceae bacterium]
MNKAAIYHRTESEYAFLYGDRDHLRLRLRTAKDDIKSVEVRHGSFIEAYHTHWSENPGPQMTKYLSTDIYDYWTIEITELTDHMPSYAFIIEGVDGEKLLYGDHGLVEISEEVLADTPANFFRLPYMHDIDRVKIPEWVTHTVWYQIFPERFGNGDKSNDPKNVKPWNSDDHPGRDDYYGGDLQGIIDHLDHLSDLGINGIYLTPIFKSPTNHKYATTDYLEIDPDFGDKNKFKELVDAAHSRGIKIMIDAVYNHNGGASFQWQDVLRNGEKSKFKDWFHIQSFPVYARKGKYDFKLDKNYDTFAFDKDMPKWNTANPEVIDYLLQVSTYWIEEFDIDAWRLDVANEVDHAFWRKFREAVTAKKKDFFILGEIWHNSQPWLNGDQFDSVMNYSLSNGILNYFLKGEMTREKFISDFNDQVMLYRDQTNQAVFNLLDSHDTARIKTVADGNVDKVKSALSFLFLHPGTPDIYYGTEFGMEGENDPDDRKPMVWDTSKQDLNMYEFTKNLIALRKDFAPIISNGTIHWGDDNQNGDQLEFIRNYKDSTLTSEFNLGENSIKVASNGRKILLGNKYQIEGESVEIEQNGFVIFDGAND